MDKCLSVIVVEKIVGNVPVWERNHGARRAHPLILDSPGRISPSLCMIERMFDSSEAPDTLGRQGRQECAYAMV